MKTTHPNRRKESIMNEPTITAEELAPDTEAPASPAAEDILSRYAAAGLTEEECYFLTHRQEMLAEAARSAEAAAIEKLTNAILSGSRRPAEAGLRDRAPAPAGIDYRRASKESREELKRRIRQAATRGELIFPGR